MIHAHDCISCRPLCAQKHVLDFDGLSGIFLESTPHEDANLHEPYTNPNSEALTITTKWFLYVDASGRVPSSRLWRTPSKD